VGGTRVPAGNRLEMGGAGEQRSPRISWGAEQGLRYTNSVHLSDQPETFLVHEVRHNTNCISHKSAHVKPKSGRRIAQLSLSSKMGGFFNGAQRVSVDPNSSPQKPSLSDCCRVPHSPRAGHQPHRVPGLPPPSTQPFIPSHARLAPASELRQSLSPLRELRSSE